MVSRKPPCAVEQCDREAQNHASGLCPAHFTRLRRHGDVQADKPIGSYVEGGKRARDRRRMTRNGEPMDFLRRVIADPPSECVVWPFANHGNGYGGIQFDGTMMTAHRAALILHGGPPPFEGAVAAHAPVTCHNRKCVNPRHLRWATQQENQFDRVLDGTANGHCHGLA